MAWPFWLGNKRMFAGHCLKDAASVWSKVLCVLSVMWGTPFTLLVGLELWARG